MKKIVQLENISKQYRLGQVGTGTLAHDLKRAWYKVQGKPDPFLKIGVNNDRAVSSTDQYVWALKNISFDVDEGDVIGIIGRNGAGKSTLLKILSRITSPTTGKITVNGRIAALLEVGTGFHPDLTGRENIFLNGAILGMRKAEIQARFDEIVEFSGCAKYIDTPVKRYSSGMIVRLGFAVAAHLDPEILIVDEVLAVGDAEFQEKCIGKMKEVSGQGRTVLFVSHNMASIKSLCKKGVLLAKGELAMQGTINDVVSHYLNTSVKAEEDGIIPTSASTYNTGIAKFKKIKLVNNHNLSGGQVHYLSPIHLSMELESSEMLPDVMFDVRINSGDGIELVHATNKYHSQERSGINPGINFIKCTLQNQLQPGNYSVTIGVHQLNGKALDFVENVLDIRVLPVPEGASTGFVYDFKLGYVRFESTWKFS